MLDGEVGLDPQSTRGQVGLVPVVLAWGCAKGYGRAGFPLKLVVGLGGTNKIV